MFADFLLGSLRGLPPSSSSNQIVSAGLKMFEKNSANNVSNCKYRLVQESVHILEPFMSDARKVGASQS